MSWHCPAWASSLDRDEVIDGDDIDDLYENHRCTRFDRSGSWTSDAYDQVINTFQDTDSSATCIAHDTDANWDETDIFDALEEHDFLICADCRTVYTDSDEYDTHQAETHGGPQITIPRRPIATSHTNWAL